MILRHQIMVRKVKNVITLAKQDGTLLTQRSNVTRTAFEATATSLYSGTIVASTAYQIRIVKVDTFKLNLLLVQYMKLQIQMVKI